MHIKNVGKKEKEEEGWDGQKTHTGHYTCYRGKVTFMGKGERRRKREELAFFAKKEGLFAHLARNTRRKKERSICSSFDPDLVRFQTKTHTHIKREILDIDVTFPFPLFTRV